MRKRREKHEEGAAVDTDAAQDAAQEGVHAHSQGPPAGASVDGGASIAEPKEDAEPAQDTVASLRVQLALAEEAKLRAMADFQNFQRRARTNERTARELGEIGVLGRVVTLLDYFQYALSQDPSKASAESILDGVRMIRGEALRLLEEMGVQEVVPQAGSLLDPAAHEAVQQVDAQGAAPGSIVSVTQPGYRVHDRVIRPAKVTVAAAPASGAGPGASPEAAEETGADA